MLAGPRSEALGGIFSVSELSTDGLGGNPAVMAENGSAHILSAHATRFWLGLPGDALFSSRLGWTSPRYKPGVFGVEFKQFGLGVHSSFGIGAGYARSFDFGSSNAIAVGLYGRWVRNQYDLSQAYRFEDDPLFNEFGNSADGFGLDAGVKYRYRNFSAGICGRNLLEPNISLSGESGEGYVEPMRVALGLAYSPIKWFTPSIEGSWDKIEGLQGAVGAEFRLFDGLLGLRTGYREGNLTFGLGINGSVSIPLTFDYAMSYPDGALSKAAVTTHSLGVTAIIPKKKAEEPKRPETWIDLATTKSSHQPDTLIFPLEKESSFSAELRNLGNLTADSFYVSAFRIEKDTFRIGAPVFVESLVPGKRIPIEWKFTPLEGGMGEILIIADNDSNGQSKIHESNKDNNRLTLQYFTSGDVVAKVEIEYAKLRINELTYIREEEPLVPVIFFEAGATSISTRFEPVLKIIAQRMIENPDIVLGLYGFADPDSDPEDWLRTGLHIERAKSISNKLVALGVPETSIKIIDSGYSPSGARAGSGAAYESAQDRLWVQQENRRVEMRAWVRDYEGPMTTIRFDKKSLEIAKSTLDSLSMFACEANIFLEENPDITLVLEGYTSDSHDFAEVYSVMDELRDYILGEITCPIDQDRFPIIVDRGDKDETELKLFVTGEGLIYRPIENALAAKDYEIPPEMEENLVRIDISSGWVKEHRVVVVGSDGGHITTLAEDYGVPPEVLFWDWKDKNGNLVDPRKSYHIELTTIDAGEGLSRFVSDEMEIVVTGVERRKESSIIVQFAFDEITSTSRYLESRIESMARRVKESALDPTKELVVRIVGHTDPIGTDRRNLVLSQERASKEEGNFRRYLRYIAGARNDVELEKWLRENNVTLIKQGVADDNPYEIERYRDGKFEKVLLGNNTFPEGRSVNRRVVVQFEEKSTNK